MRKALILLFGIFFYTGTIQAQTNHPANIEKMLRLDTSKLNNLIFRYDHRNAILLLSNYLNTNPPLDPADLITRWLQLALFQAWPVNLKSSSTIGESLTTFDRYTALSAGKRERPIDKANRLLYKAFVLSRDSSFMKAGDSLIASITLRPAGDRLNQMILADSYEELAKLNKRNGDLSEATRNYQRSINLNKRLQRTIKLANDLSNLANVISLMNPKDAQADSLLNESLYIYSRMDSTRAEAQVLNELGALNDRRHNFTESLKYFKKSLAKKMQIKGLESDEFPVVLSNIGTCYLYMNKIDSTRYFYLKAVDYAKKSGRYLADCYLNLGASYGLKDNYQESINYFQKALNCLDPSCSATDPRQNPKMSQVSRRLADITAFKAHSFHRNYHINKNPQDLVNGLEAFGVALDMIDTLRYIYSFEGKPYLSGEAKIHYFNALDIACDLYEITGNPAYMDTAFQFSERNKSAVLNEFLRSNQEREFMGNMAPWLDSEDSLKHLINVTEAKILKLRSGQDYPSDSIDAQQEKLSTLKDELINLVVKAKREHPGYYQRVFQKHPFAPRVIQKLLNPGEAMIDYTVVRDNRLSLDYMTVIVLTRDTLFTFRDTLQPQFRKDIDSFRYTITSFVDTKNFQDFSRLSNLMYRYFFQPVEKFRGIDKLIILPDEELGLLPFEVFVTDTIKPRGSDFRKFNYLNRKYQISYISSHEQLYQFRKNKSTRKKAVVYAFAPFERQGVKVDTLNLLALENSAKEIKSVSEYFRTKRFENAKAGEVNLRKAFEKQSVITLSTHGLVNREHPMESRLMLNPSQPDGSLYLFEMLAVKINSPLVILNACNTGNGLLQVGEGIMSMARGFQFAGVRTVITTLWPIDDQSSATVMDNFFKNLNSGMDQGEALMKARNSYIDHSTKANGAPYFWAGQVLIGDPGPIAIQPRQSPLIWVSLLLLGVIVSLVLVFLKKRS